MMLDKMSDQTKEKPQADVQANPMANQQASSSELQLDKKNDSRAPKEIQANIHEGSTTRMIENQTARIPSVGFLGLAVGSMVLSSAIGLRGGKERGWLANFVGQWAPCFMLLGIYNKIVKLESEFARSQMH